MRDENPPRCCISGERVFFWLSLGTFETLDHLQTGSCFCPRCTRLEKSVHCCIVSIGTYGEEFRLLPRHIKTRKRIRRRNYTLCSSSINEMRMNICCRWRINQIGENREESWIYVRRRCVVREMRPPDTMGFIY